MSREEVADRLREAAATLRGGGELWNDEWAEVFDEAAELIEHDPEG